MPVDILLLHTVAEKPIDLAVSYLKNKILITCLKTIKVLGSERLFLGLQCLGNHQQVSFFCTYQTIS